MIGKPILSLIATVLILGLSGHAAAQSRIDPPAVDGFVVAYEASNATQSIREAIPAGETLENWSRMITTQRFAGYPASPLHFARGIKSSVAASCSRTTMSEPRETTHQGFSAATFSVTCFRPAERGGVETFYLLAVAAPDALLVMQVAFKDDATEENTRAAVDLLSGATICERDCRRPQ